MLYLCVYKYITCVYTDVYIYICMLAPAKPTYSLETWMCMCADLTEAPIEGSF